MISLGLATRCVWNLNPIPWPAIVVILGSRVTFTKTLYGSTMVLAI